jgi:hypothetical protein
MRVYFYLIILTIVFASLSYASEEERVKILQKEKEIFETEKNMNIEYNNRKNMINTNTNECLGRAKTKKDIRECNRYKKNEMEFLNKEFKYRKEQLAQDKKQLAEDKKSLTKKKRRRN